MENIRKEVRETEDEFIYRVCRNKDLKVYDLTWVEVGGILNRELGNNYSESAYRKEYQALQRGLDLAQERSLEDQEIIDEIEEKKMELYKQQTKTRDQLRKLRATLRDEARLDNLKDTFIECAEIVSEQKPLSAGATPSKSNKEGRVGVLGLADWHVGEVVDNFLNTYDVDIFHKRMEKLTKDVINYCKLMSIDTLKVLNLGDLISGNIRISTRIISEMDAVSQVMVVAEAVANMLTEFAKEVNKIEFYSVSDNHGRITADKNKHIERENFSLFIVWFLEERVRHVGNIEVIENKINDVREMDIGMFDIFHEKALFTHGHNGRLNSMVQDLALMTRTFPISIFTGHFHKNFEDEVHNIDLIMSPSGIGSGEYSNSIRRSSAPRQKLTIYENNNGNVERVSTFFINFD